METDQHDFVLHLLSCPVLDDNVASVFDEIEAERARNLPREVDFGSDGLGSRE